METKTVFTPKTGYVFFLWILAFKNAVFSTSTLASFFRGCVSVVLQKSDQKPEY